MRVIMFCLVAILAASTARAEILFHQRAFADAVVDSNLLAGYNDPNSALGRNDWTADMVGVNQWGRDIGTSLGNGGYLTFEFIDNAIGGSGNSDKDLWVFEIGGVPEELLIEISPDGSSWLNVGIADRVSATVDYGVGVDIDQYFTTGNGYDTATRFRYMRVTDTGNNTYNMYEKAGADIDAVAAIYPLSNQTTSVPEPATLLLLSVGLALLPRRRRR